MADSGIVLIVGPVVISVAGDITSKLAVTVLEFCPAVLHTTDQVVSDPKLAMLDAGHEYVLPLNSSPDAPLGVVALSITYVLVPDPLVSVTVHTVFGYILVPVSTRLLAPAPALVQELAEGVVEYEVATNSDVSTGALAVPTVIGILTLNGCPHSSDPVSVHVLLAVKFGVVYVPLALVPV